MKRLLFFAALAVALGACNNKGKGDAGNSQQTQGKTYECELFSVAYPDGYYAKEDGSEDGSFHILLIGKDSLNDDMTTIMWQTPGKFTSSVRDFITLFVTNEMEEFQKAETFYQVINVDTMYMIDGHRTFTVSSLYAEGNDSIIQSRTGLIIPQRCDMMVIQRASTKMSMDDVQAQEEIINSIRIKE